MPDYVLKTEKVQECLDTVLRSSFHQHFPAYLCIKRLSKQEGRTDHIVFATGQMREFFNRFLAVEHGGDPYIRPFVPGDSRDIWISDHLAGMYAPSSVRDSALREVVQNESTGQNAEWTLRDNHWELARTHLADGHPVDAQALAGFLYREFTIEADEPPGCDELVDIFKDEFGYSDSTVSEDGEFDHLYTTDGVSIDADNFEAYEEDDDG